MARWPRIPKRTAVALLLFGLILTGLLLQNSGRAGAQSVISEPTILPGDLGSFAAAGPQEQQKVARGNTTSLAVWSDSRTRLSITEAGTRSATSATGEGSQKDIYAARIGGDGQIIDNTSIVVDQGGFEQTDPQVGWNGQNWLVVYTSQKENDYFRYEVRAKRVSPSGEVLDASPIILDADATFRHTLTASVIDDGAGNWLVVYKDTLPNEGTSIPVGVFVMRVANDGSVLDPDGRVIYNHHSQYMDKPKLTRAGDRYLLTFYDITTSNALRGLTFDANFVQLRSTPQTLVQYTNGYDVATDGNIWFVTSTGSSGQTQGLYGTRITRDGNPLDAPPILISNNVGLDITDTAVCWDGQYWFVAYANGYDPAAQSYSNGTDIYFARVTSAGALLDGAQGRPVKLAEGSQLYPSITPGVNGGAEVAWYDLQHFDLDTAHISREGVVSAEAPLARSAYRQAEVRMASSGSGFLAVFRSESAGVSRIMAQHLDAQGNPVDEEPFVVADGARNNNPSVAWDGSQYLVVWDDFVPQQPSETRFTPIQTFGRLVPASGAPFTPKFYLMDGDSPDAAGLNGQFLVVNVVTKSRQIRKTQVVRVSSSGVPVGTPVEIAGVFNYWPRVVAFGTRWFAVWEYHANHDDAPGTIYGAFIEQDGTVQTPFVVGDAGNDRTPHLAVGGNTALVAWSNNDIYTRRINADGTSPDQQSVGIIVNAATIQARPAVAWDGNQFVLDWVDQRNEPFPFQAKGDIFGARVSTTNVKLEEFSVAASSLPEETPFIISSNGLTLFSYAKFYDDALHTSYRITLRKANLPVPSVGSIPAAPGNLVATQKNEGTGSVSITWTDNSTNETGFKIEARTNAGAWNQVRVVGADTTTASGLFTGVNDSTSFRVRAYNAAGDSAYSNEASGPIVKLNYFDPPTKTEPANVTVSATASDPEGIARVEFHYATDTTYPNYQLLATDTQAPYSYDWTNVPKGYYYVVAKAFDAQGSTTETLYESFVVYGAPTATITSPANGATFLPGASITITATAQANSSQNDYYVNRVDFYANTTLIGSVVGHYEQYSFTWTNVPTGSYSLTARPTTSNYLTGTSNPVNITVGNPGANISGRITTAGGGTGLYNVRVALTGSQSAVVMTDADGNYVITNVAVGGNYTVTPTVAGYTFSPASLSFNNFGGSQTGANFTGTAGASVTPDPNAVAIYSQQYDGRAQELSWKQPVGEQVDVETADDFELTGTITRVVFGGTRGFQAPSNPTVYGVFVRFYDGSSGTPGALQAEYYLPAGSPGLIYDRTNPGTLDITLPTPFNATGKHFISPQLVTRNNGWGALSANYPNIRGSGWLVRNNANGGGWAPPWFAHDMMFDLYGTLRSTPRIDSMSPQSIPRSGLLQINGAFFGAAQGSSQLKIDGRTTPHIITWEDDFIAAYVPEGTALGNVPVEITTAAGTGRTTLNVTTRPTDGRIKWRFTMAGDYARHRSAVGPDGTAYVNDTSGRLYALSPDGALKWIFQAGLLGAIGPVTVGADGTIYVAGFVQMDASCPASDGSPFGDGVFAVNPDGTQKWLFNQTCNGIIAGPNVGPDGKIYGVTDYSGIGVFALTPQGTLAYAVDRNVINEHGPTGEEIVFGPSAPGLLPTQQYFQFDQSALDPQGLLFGYTIQGQRVFTAVTVITGQPAVSQFSGNVYAVTFPIGAGTKLRSYTPQGVVRWQSPIMVNSGMSAPDVAPDETVYVVGDGSVLYAVEPATGQARWAYDDPHIMFDPIVSPDNRLVLMGGRITFGEPGLFIAVSTQGQLLWKQQLPDFPGLDPYGQVVPSNRLRFAPDGQTAYIAADVLEDRLPRDRVFSYFYALDTSANNVPINEQPKVTMTSPLDGATYPKVSTINLSATATDDQPVSGVEFYMQRGFESPPVLISIDTTAPYTATFNTDDDGSYSFIAAVRDVGGLVGESRVTIITSNEPPRITWRSPASGTSFPPGSTVTLEANAFDPDGTVSKVEFYSNNVGLIGTDTTPDANGNFSINFSPANGSHNLTAWATDNDGTRISATNSITVGASPTPTPTPVPTPTPTPLPPPGAPSVVITSPTSGASFAPGTNVTLTAEASDSDGTITRVDFFRQSSPTSPLCTGFNPPYTCQVMSASPAIVNVYAEARDNDGKLTRSQTVQVVFYDPAGQYTIAGRLRHISSQPGNEVFLPHALVKLRLGNNFNYREARTDAQGKFSFDHLMRGGDYTVTPSEPGYQFYPPSVAWMGLVEDEYQEFIAEGARPPGPTPTPAPGSNVLAWEKFYNSPYNLSDYNSHVVIDAQGNTLVTGASLVPGDRGDTDISTVKYSPNGEQLWAKTFVGLGNYKDWPTDIKVDAEGNVYVAGTSWRGRAFSYDFVTIKYDANGTQQWVQHLNGPLGHSDFGNALALDSSGNIIVTGYVRSRDPFTTKIYDEFATVKYTPDGTEAWVSRRTEAQLSDHAIDAVVDSTGNIYVTGFAYAITNGVETKDLVTVKYSPDGQELWATRHNGRAGSPGPNPLPSNPIADEPGGVGLDPSGNVYVFGSNEPGTAEDDFLLLKYNPATGALVWGRNWSGPAYDYARDMAIDSSGNIYLTGETYDKIYQTVNDNPSSDAATVKFDPAGNLVWERVYRAFPGKWDGGRRISLDASGNAYVGAYSEGFFNSDTAVIKYQPDGTEAWVYRYDNPNNTSDSLGNMDSDADGNLYLTGHAAITTSSGTSVDFITLKLAASTVTLNSPPEVTLIIGPTIAGNPTTGNDTPPPTGPTIAGRTVKLSSEAFDRDGTVSRVEFFDSGVLIGTDTTSPYAVDWANPSEGTHAVNAMATDNVGATRTTPTQAVTVAPEPETFAISGQVTLNGSPFEGVQVSLSGAQTASATTGTDGRYTFAGLAAGGDYTVTPARTDYAFTPSNRTVTALNADYVADFAAASTAGGAINVALATNGATVTASSQYSASFPALAAIDGDRFHLYRSDGRYNIWHSAPAKPKPDWLEVTFASTKTITQVDVITMQDDYNNAVEPTAEMTSVNYGLSAFEVQYWTGTAWATVTGGSVTGNNKVWRRFTFPAVTTSKVRVVVSATMDAYSRIVEVEAWGRNAEAPPPPPARVNVALAANGATATASSQYNANFPVAAAIDGDRYHLNMPDGRYNMWHSAAGAQKPDWLRVNFAAARVIDEINVVTQQDDYANAVDPTEATAFTKYGLTSFEVQYWTGTAWATVTGGGVTGNNKVWRKFTFAPVTTASIRVLVHSTADGFSRVWELEAWGNSDTAPPSANTNVALATNGATVTASSQYSASFPALAAIDGDRFHLYRSDGRYNIWHSAPAKPKPDWLEVTFASTKTITQVDVITMQDDYNNAVEPTAEMTSVNYGLSAFEVQYWTGTAWATVTGGSVTGNNKVWRRFTFPAVTTSKVRVVVSATMDAYSRIVEVEAWGKDAQAPASSPEDASAAPETK